jgi:hypothetical protein
MTNSLFGYMAQRFGSSAENLATESLLYVLRRSLTAKRAFFRYLEQTGCTPLPDSLRLASQSMDKEDKSIPDLVGLDAQNKSILICESKFWAGLTNNQPVTYLEQLERASGSLLLILGPTNITTRLHITTRLRLLQRDFKV